MSRAASPPGPLAGTRVLDLTDHAGALVARLLAGLGADVVRVEPPGGAAVRGIGPFLDGVADPSASAADWFCNAGKRGIAIDPEDERGRRELRERIAGADVLVEARPPSWLRRAGIAVDEPVAAHPRLVHLAITPFGATGPRAGWRGTDAVCAAAAGMTFVNGFPGEAPITPFGLAAHAATGVFGAIGALLALLRRERTGRGGAIDLSIAAATAAAVEHVTGFRRQNGASETRRGTLHWSRSFRIAPCREGDLLACILGDWTTLVEWVTSEADLPLLRDPRWDDVDERKAGCTAIFDALDRWAAPRDAGETALTAQLLRLPFARVRAAHEVARDEQLAARGFPQPVARGGGRPAAVLPGAPFRMSESPWRAATAPPRVGEHGGEVAGEPLWAGPVAPEPALVSGPAVVGAAVRPLDGIVVLDFTWVVAGPVATRLLADHGARVVKVERANAGDFGSRRGGLSGNLNRGKESIVIDLATAAGRAVALRLAARSDVVIDNFSARVMGNLGLDHERLRAVRPDVISVGMSGFGRTGPWRDHVSYGPTLQALAGYPYLMRLPGGPPAGWGYSWSDMAAGMMAALATLAALAHRRRTGRGQHVDLAQHETLWALLGPASLDLLRGRPVAAPGNASQEGALAPHGIYRCAAEVRGGRHDDDRWIAIAVPDDPGWRSLAALLAGEGEGWAGDPALARAADRVARAAEIDRRLGAWARRGIAGELATRLQAAGVPAAVVADGEDICEADPQLRARGFFRTAVAPDGERFVFDGNPFAGDELGAEVRAPGPLLGEHTDRVLAELAGLSPAEIAGLRGGGVVA